MQTSEMTPWRWMAGIVSSAGCAGVVVVWSMLDEVGTGYLVLGTIPLLVGLAATLGNMKPPSRILLLWVAAALSGLVAALTIFSGAGFVLLPVMVGYLLTAWKMNEPETDTAR